MINQEQKNLDKLKERIYNEFQNICSIYACDECPYLADTFCNIKFTIDYLAKNNLLSNLDNFIPYELDFRKIKDGDHFTYRGIEFVRLGKEQGGILCITAKIWKKLPFDKDGCNNFKKASICKALDAEFRPLLDDNDLLTYQMDLTADNGDKTYGTFFVHAGLLSADLYRKYRDYIPHYDDWVWLSTPWYCSGGAGIVRGVYTDGVLHAYNAYTAIGVVPACIFKEN